MTRETRVCGAVEKKKGFRIVLKKNLKINIKSIKFSHTLKTCWIPLGFKPANQTGRFLAFSTNLSNFNSTLTPSALSTTQSLSTSFSFSFSFFLFLQNLLLN